MRNSLWLACILIGFLGSCEATAPNLENLRCPMPPATSTPDVPASGADPALFGSLSKDSTYNCIKNPSICAALGTNFSCNLMQGCCDEKFMGRCNKSSDCIYNDKPVCDLTNNICVSCSSTNMVMGDQQCGAWSASQVDPLNRSLCISGLCAECRTGNDCKRAGKTFCDQTDNLCKGCTMHSQCLPGSGICKLDSSLLATGDQLTNIGECVSTNDVVYVDRGYVNCSTGDGTQLKPFCELNQAVATGKSYISLKGNGTAMVNTYQAVTVDGGKQVAVFGPGRDVPAAQQALISGVTVTGGARFTISGVTVTHNSGQPAVQCNGSASLYMQNAQVTNAFLSGGGIYANQCTRVVVEKTRINAVAGNGIFITGGSGHRVINNAIVNGQRNSANTMEQYGLRLSGNADGLFAFNTIANNFQGIQCDSSVSVTDSIIVSNGAGAQVGGNCLTPRTVIDASKVSLDASFMLTTNALNDTCCVDKGLPDTNMTIKDDYDSTKRPLGGGYDIGFHEAR